MDKCPSIINWVRQFQLCSDIFLEKYTCATVDVPQQVCHSRCATAGVPQQMCHSRCATAGVPQRVCHSRCATVDVHQQIMKT